MELNITGENDRKDGDGSIILPPLPAEKAPNSISFTRERIVNLDWRSKLYADENKLSQLQTAKVKELFLKLWKASGKDKPSDLVNYGVSTLGIDPADPKKKVICFLPDLETVQFLVSNFDTLQDPQTSAADIRAVPHGTAVKTVETGCMLRFPTTDDDRWFLPL